VGLIVGLIVGLNRGGSAVIKHYALRLVLWYKSQTPGAVSGIFGFQSQSEGLSEDDRVQPAVSTGVETPLESLKLPTRKSVGN